MRKIDHSSSYYEEFNQFTDQLKLRICELRKKQGLTQADMERFELSLRQYQRIEKGDTVNVTLGNLYKIAKALKTDLNQLLDINVSEPPKPMNSAVTVSAAHAQSVCRSES